MRSGAAGAGGPLALWAAGSGSCGSIPLARDRVLGAPACRPLRPETRAGPRGLGQRLAAQSARPRLRPEGLRPLARGGGQDGRSRGDPRNFAGSNRMGSRRFSRGSLPQPRRRSLGRPRHEEHTGKMMSPPVDLQHVAIQRGLAGPSRAIALHPALRQFADTQPIADFGLGVLRRAAAPNRSVLPARSETPTQGITSHKGPERDSGICPWGGQPTAIGADQGVPGAAGSRAARLRAPHHSTQKW